MLEIRSPLITELLAKCTQDTILRVLRRRFGKVSPDVRKQLRIVISRAKLNKLICHAAVCPSMEAFRDQLLS